MNEPRDVSIEFEGLGHGIDSVSLAGLVLLAFSFVSVSFRLVVSLSL